jgi:hypothetical protein
VNDLSDCEASNDGFAYVLGSKTTTSLSHPPAHVIHRLWQTFIENVNPLMKLVHVPSLQPAIERAIININHIPRGFEALMFAIYSMAVLSLGEDECKGIVGESRAIQLPRYIAATKTALSRARFMSSTSIVVLQALVLHILSIRDICEPRALWSLTGVAIRVAEGMGMRIDGTLLGLSPFETEIRRRIWWQLKIHDFRAAELSGQPKLRDFELDETTPKKPGNINDSDLYAAMPQAAAESNKPTEMIWCMLRVELASFAASQKAKLRKLGKGSDEYSIMNNSAMKKDAFIKEMEDIIETKYLRFCDPSQPLQLMALLGARVTINIVRFLAYHPRRWTNLNLVPASEQQMVWSIVVQLLEQYNMMQSAPQLQHFAWIVPYFIQWHAAIHVLDTLRIHPRHTEAVKAWKLVEILYEKNSEMLLSISRPISVAVGNICLKAFDARTASLTTEEQNLSTPPKYIAKLRELREVAKARRKADFTSSKEQKTFEDKTATETSAAWPDGNPRLAEKLAEAPPQFFSVAKRPAYPVQRNAQTEDDAFWLSDALDDRLFAGDAVDGMDLDMDAILTQNHWLDVPNGEAIDWAQLDTWLGNLDPTSLNVGTAPG